MPAWRQDSVTGGTEMNFGGHEKFINVNSRVWIKKKRAFSLKISTNSGFHLKILVIFHES